MKTTLFMLLFIPIAVFGQNGPGGVGSKDGSSSLKLWLDADSATVNMSDEVTGWDNLVNISQLDMVNTTFSPNYISAKFNGHATVSFENQADAMETNSTLSNTYFPETAASSFVVTQHDNLSQQSSTYATEPYENGNRFSTHMPWANTIYYDIGECCTGDGRINYTYDSDWLTELSVFAYRAGSGYAKEAWRNNVSQVTGTTATATFTSQSSYTFQIGHSSSSNFQGDISEVIIYNVGLNDAQMTIVNNYLAAKFDMSISDDFYVFESTHGNELIGVGQNGTDTHTEAKSSEILTIKDPNALGDGDYVFAGHDNADISTWTSTEQMNEDADVERLAREWRVDVTGTPGTVTLSLDPSILPASSADYDFYMLWTDTDGDFTNGATAHPLTPNGGEFEATGVTLSDGMFIAVSTVRPVIQFSSSSSNGDEETANSPDFEVSLNYAVSGDIDVDYAFADGTAISPGEYTSTDGTATITSGSTSVQITTASIQSDTDVEDDETFTVTLSNPEFGILGTTTVHTYSINDNDNTQIVQFDAPYSYSYKKRITIDNSKVEGSSDLEDFPVLISLTDTDLRTTGNGGNVENVQGYDIRFTYANGVTWLDHDLEYYVATTGEYVAWVRIPVLSYDEDTEIDMYYGNASVASDPSVSTTWVDYHAVYHLGQDDVSDATGTYNGTNSGTTDAAGKTGRSQQFDGSDIVELVGFPDVNSQFTLSMWFNTTDDTHNGRLFSDDANNNGWALSFGDPGDQLIRTFNRGFAGAGVIDAVETFSTGNWYYVALVVDRVNEDRIIYADGQTSISDLSDVGTWGTDAGNAAIGGEGTGGEAVRFEGYIDEVRMSSVIRNADWIETEYNNQDSPGTFYSVGSEIALSGFIISEATDTVALTVALNNTSGSATTVDYAAVSGTATSGSDYVLASGTLTIPANELSSTFNIDITNDLIDEADETVVIQISNPSNANLGTNNTITLTIEDNDTSPTIEFADPTSTVNEGTSQFDLAVNLSAASGQAVTVDYAVTGGTATSNDDFILSSGTLTITAGNLSQDLIVNVIDDSDIEVPETIEITISNPSGATLGTNTINTVTINDNDNLGFDGPGGIGSADGSGTLTMWFMADSATVNGSDQVTGLDNLVGISAYDMVNTSNLPDHVSNAINGHAEVSFNNVNDAMVTNSVLSASTFPYNEASTFIVTRHDNNSQTSNTYGTSTTQGGGLGGNRFSTHLPWSNNVYFDIGTCCGSTARVNFAYDGAWVGSYSIFSYIASSTDGKSVYRNNTLEGGPIAGTSAFNDHTNNYFHLGQSQSTDFQGDITEFILFTRPVNSAQRIIMNNYLAAKYGLTIANDYYVWQASHPHEMAGIGQEDSNNNHVAAKAGAITIGSPGDLDDGEYVMFGHDNLDASSWSATDIPSGDFQRLTREWRFGLTGAPGSITISIDPDLLPTLPSGYTDYVVLVDDNGTFSSGADVYQTSLISGEYVTSSIDIANGDYVTIGTLKRAVQFTSTAVDKIESSQGLLTIELDYTSGSDITVDYTIGGGTATGGGVDYSVANSGTITLLAGQSEATLDLGIIDESDPEGDETVIVTLSNPSSNAQLGTNTVFTYTITDDDNTREFFFADPCEFGYVKTITIDNGQVSGSSDLTNFPLLINISGDTDLANNVQHANGYDIYFRVQDSLFWLTHEIEYFNGGTGDLVAWVLLPILDYDEDMVIEMYYGNSDITLDPSSPAVWDDYLGVWHLDDVTDATSNEYDGTNNGTASVAARFGNGRDFDGVGDFIELASFPDLQQDFSISAWINVDNIDAGQRIFIDDDNNTNGYALSVGDPGGGRVRFYSRGAAPTSVDGGASQAVSAGSWFHVTGVADYDASGSRVIYVNSVEAANQTHTNQFGTDVGSAAIGGETLSGETGNRFTGTMDEVRVYDGLLSAERVATEYANQQESSTFYTLGSETTNTGCVVAETDGIISVMVAINPADNAGATTATYTATAGTAIQDQDYTLDQGTVQIDAGATSATFEFELTNDLLDETNETLTITLSNPSTNAKIGSNSTITYTITDDDDVPEVEFVDNVSSVNEGTATVTVGIKLSAESGNDVTVDYSVFSSTATSGDDYIFPAGTATITAGNLNTNITLSIIDDEDIEVLENIVIDIASPTNATLGTETRHTMTINDNDDLGFNGPGGVGENDGSKTLKLWLAADSATVSGTDVTGWDNAVTNVTGLDFAPVGTSPTRVDDAVNGHSEISFANVNDALVSNSTLSATTFPYNEGTFFIVSRTDNLGQISNAYATATAATGALPSNQVSGNLPGNGNAEFEISGVGISMTYETAWADGDHNIFAHRITSDSSIVWRNNNIEGQTSTNSSPFTNHPTYNFYIGREETNPFQGDIAELIMFTRPVNNSQMTIVNNYLSSKYDISISNDLYVFDLTHGNEVAGIGQSSATDQHVAARAGVVTISNASDLDDGEYVLFGHDNASTSSWVSSNVPEGDSIRRVAREWRFATTGSPGTITIAIDQTQLPTPITGYEDYVVFVDKDGDFSEDATVYQTTLVDGQYKASEVPIASADYVTIGMIIRTIEFDVAISNDTEDNSQNVVINMNYAYNEDITFDYEITGGTATGGNDDYSTASTGTISILTGQTTAELPLGINNDTDVESDETIEITIRNAPSGFRISADSVHVYTINDDDNARNVQFNLASSGGTEDVGNVSLQVDLNVVDPINDTKVYYSITGGTAEASPAPDFTFTADTLTIAATTLSANIDFSILDDVLDETVETIEISLSSPSNANLGTNAVHTYSITDNDNAVTVEFQNATTTIDEGGSIAQVVVELSNPSGQTVTVDYAVTGGTATGGGIDYALADGTLSIAAGNQIKTINVALTDDSSEEVAETIIIDLSNPTAATLGSQVQHTVSITDNDATFGYYGPGGVGSKNRNILWLDAESINGRGVANPADGSSISTWVDRSGNSKNFTAIGTQPTYDETGLNSRETISISTGADGFRAPANFTNSLGNYSFVSVVEQTSGQYLAETNTAANGDFRLNQGTNGLYHLNGNNRLTGNSSTDLDIMVWTFNEQSTPEADVYRDGTALDSDNNYSVMALDNNFSIGGRASGASTADFGGNISEFIVYKKPLNSAQRVIVENYLSSKYGIAVANDYYTYDGTYGNDVIGIGQASATEFHLQSMSDSLLMLSGASTLGDGDYVFGGHDGGDKTTWTTTEAPNSGSNIRRIAREWRVDVTGTPGTLIIKVDTTQLPTPPSGYDQYVVWTDADGDFRNGSTTYQVEYSPIFGFHVSDPVTVSDGTFIAIGVGQPVVQFTMATSDGFEDDTNPSIEVSLNFTLGEDVTINYAATGGTAVGSNIDYLLTSGTLTIPEGQTTANIIPGIIDDNTQENDETIIITLTTPSENVSLGSISEHTYTIHDNDNIRSIEFQTPLTANASETVDTYTVTVEIDVVDASNPTTVDLVPVNTGNYATLGDDYTLSTTTVTIPATATTATFDITIIDESLFESDETITLDLTNPMNAQLGTNNQFVYTINNDDTAPTVEFTETNSFASESSGSAGLEVSISSITASDVTVDYSVTASTATDGVDFTLADGTLTISAGDLDDNIFVTLVEDVFVESTETITVTISNPGNATLGTNTTHVLNIVDNDAGGSTGPGGVGDDSSNISWLKAADFSTGTGVWSDESGNGYDLNGAGGANTPTLTGSNANFNNQSTVTFDGSQYFDADNITSSAADYDIFYVLRSDGTTSDQLLFHVDDTDDISLGFENANGSYEDLGGWNGTEITHTGTGILHYHLADGTNNADVNIDGSLDNNSSYSSTAMAGNKALGASVAGASGFAGDIGEVVIYNSLLNDAQRVIVLNYLSSKFGVDISGSGLDRYAHDGAGFTEDLIGIGQVDATNLHVEATSQDFLTFKNPNNLGDGEYLLAAHDNAAMGSWVTSEVPNASTYRVAREWRVDMTGNVGTVTVEIDTLSLPAPAESGLSWVLLIDSDGDFSAVDDIQVLTPVTGDIVAINDVDFSTNTYFTLAQMKFQTVTSPADFNSPATWSTGIVPYAGVDVTIATGHDIYLTEDTEVGSITVETGSTLDLNGFTLDFTDGCITLNGTGTVDVATAGSTIGYVNPNVISQCVTGMTYNNIYTYGIGGSIKYLTGDIIVEGDINLTSPVGPSAFFDARNDGTTDDYDITLRGDWISEITFHARTGTVTFDGTSDQIIDTNGGETFNNLTVNKASGTLNMSSEVNVGGTVNMTAGNIDLGTQDLNVLSGGAIANGDASSYIICDDVGVLRHAVTSLGVDLDFPIGDTDEYAPFTFTLNVGTLGSSNVTINMRDTKHTEITESNYITRYWSLNRENITSPVDYDVSYIYQNADIVGTEAFIFARKFSSEGDAVGGTFNRGQNLLAFAGHTSFSDHTGESEDEGLPVELVSFTGEVVGSSVLLRWTTASEIENDYFQVEKSEDGINYQIIGEVEGNGTINSISRYSFVDESPYHGAAYYRLVQIDFDGDYEVHDPISVMFNANSSVLAASFYPNPTNVNNLNARITSNNDSYPILITMYNLSGRLVFSQLIEPFVGVADFKLEPQYDLGRGVYQMITKQGGTVKTQKVIIN